MVILGIDPAPRHTGYYLAGSSPQPVKGEWKGDQMEPLLTRGLQLREEMKAMIKFGDPDLIVMERMLPSARSGGHLFYVQMILLEAIELTQRGKPTKMLHPFPIQLKSFVLKKWGRRLASGTDKVQLYREVTKDTRRVSEHTADAYFLTELGRAVAEGRFTLNLPEKEMPLTSWDTNNWLKQTN